MAQDPGIIQRQQLVLSVWVTKCLTGLLTLPWHGKEKKISETAFAVMD